MSIWSRAATSTSPFRHSRPPSAVCSPTRGAATRWWCIRCGAAEAIEAVAHGDKRTSKVVGRALQDIKLPPGTNIGAIVRGDEVLIAHHDTVIESEDHVILFLVDKRRIGDVERLFQVGVTFI